MNYIATDGRTAELMGRYIDSEGRVIANIDGKAQAVDDCEIVKEFDNSLTPSLKMSLIRDLHRRRHRVVDMINHPPHYTSSPSGIECIEIAELLPFCLGNCYKYLHRAGLKGDASEDLQKALWYAKRARLNNENITKRAKNRINHVALSRSDKNIKHILILFAGFKKNYRGFVSNLMNYIEQLQQQNTKI